MDLYTGTRPVATDSDGSAVESTPAELDPTSCPIIARHFFGIKPLRSIDPIAAALVASPRRQRAADHLYNVGPRPVLEALVEVEAGADLDSVLADFARLDPETVRQLGGDQFPAVPIHTVRS